MDREGYALRRRSCGVLVAALLAASACGKKMDVVRSGKLSAPVSAEDPPLAGIGAKAENPVRKMNQEEFEAGEINEGHFSRATSAR